jgi:hypothetical protein
MWLLEKQGSVVVGSSNKRHKQKDAHHAFKWKKLENPDIQAEMYHIDKLWPKEWREAHTKNFACKPSMC